MIGLVDRVAMSAAGQVHHTTIHYSGRVQGVGFRYTTLQLARGYDVAGYVQNLPDSRVRIEVEGGREEVDGFLAAIYERMHGFVRQAERLSEERPRRFSGFSIR